MFGASHLMSNEVVAQSVQTAGDVGQAHGCLYEHADAGLVATVLNHFLVHLELCEGLHMEDTFVYRPAYMRENHKILQ